MRLKFAFDSLHIIRLIKSFLLSMFSLYICFTFQIVDVLERNVRGGAIQRSIILVSADRSPAWNIYKRFFPPHIFSSIPKDVSLGEVLPSWFSSTMGEGFLVGISSRGRIRHNSTRRQIFGRYQVIQDLMRRFVGEKFLSVYRFSCACGCFRCIFV